MKFNIEIVNTQSQLVDIDDLRGLAQLIWQSEGKTNCDIRAIITDDKQLRDLNRQFKQREYDTDILSFRLSDEPGSLFEGEIYISAERVRENAVLFKVTEAEEFRRILAHGLLHFLGYDDLTEADKAEMTERENFYLARTLSDIPD